MIAHSGVYRSAIFQDFSTNETSEYAVVALINNITADEIVYTRDQQPKVRVIARIGDVLSDEVSTNIKPISELLRANKTLEIAVRQTNAHAKENGVNLLS